MKITTLSKWAYDPGSHTYTRDQAGARYVLVAIRTLVNPEDQGDVTTVHALQDAITVHALQDAIKVNQKDAGSFEIPAWDKGSQDKVRAALLMLGSTLGDTKKMFGTKDQVDPVRHLIGSATAWGGNPERDAIYLNVVPGKNDGKTIYRLHVKDGADRKQLVNLNGKRSVVTRNLFKADAGALDSERLSRAREH